MLRLWISFANLFLSVSFPLSFSPVVFTPSCYLFLFSTHDSVTAGRVQISYETFAALNDLGGYKVVKRGEIEIKVITKFKKCKPKFSWRVSWKGVCALRVSDWESTFRKSYLKDSPFIWLDIATHGFGMETNSSSLPMNLSINLVSFVHIALNSVHFQNGQIFVHYLVLKVWL